MKMASVGRAFACGMMLATATTGHAQDRRNSDNATPAVIQRLYDCRAITDPAARLACYDAQVAAVQTAQQSRDVRIVDREQMRETRRGLFGFSLGNLGIFGGGDRDEAENRAEEVTEIQAMIRSASYNRDGGVVMTLDNDQVWVQTDSRPVALTPRAGQNVRIRRAALGSFMASVENRPGIRVRRER